MSHTYPYLFQTSGFASVDAVRAELESQSDWDRIADPQMSAATQNTASARFGITPPFSNEELALRAYLIRNNAGPLISTYGWGLLADSRMSLAG